MNFMDLRNKKTVLTSLVICTAVFGFLIVMGFQISEAQMGGNPLTDRIIGPRSPGQFGAATANVVCGDRLCNEPVPQINIEDSDVTIGEEPDYTPTLTLNSATMRRASSAATGQIVTVLYSVTCGAINLQNITVEVSSDMDSEDFTIGSCTSLNTSENVARIRAMDPDSIFIELTGYQIAPPTGDPRRG